MFYEVNEDLTDLKKDEQKRKKEEELGRKKIKRNGGLGEQRGMTNLTQSP